MTKISLLPFLAIATFAQSPAKPPSADLFSGRGVLDNGVAVSYRINYEPWPPSNPAYNSSLMGFDPAGSNTLRHYICDTDSGSCLGVEMQVFGPPSNMQVTFGPIPMSPDLRARLDEAGRGRPLNFIRLPKYPPPQTVRVGDTLAIDLGVSTDGKDKIVEYFKFTAAPEPGDATIDDVTFFDIDPRIETEIVVDGQSVAKIANFIDPQIGGSTLWIYVPGHGRYIASLAPHNGFTKAGSLRGGAASFHAGGHKYEIRGLLHAGLFLSPQSEHEKSFNLYVFHDTAWLPATTPEYATGGVDRLANLLSRR
jgi:hypothetical protein